MIHTGELSETVTRTTWLGKYLVLNGKESTLTWEEVAAEYLADGSRVMQKEDLRAPVFCTVRDECAIGTCDRCNEDKPIKRRHRCDKATTSVTALAFEYDGKVYGWKGIVDFLSSQGLASLVYDTPSSTSDAPKWRLVLPISEPWVDCRVWSATYARLRTYFEGLFDLEFDKTTGNPSRIFYPPTRPTEETPNRRVLWTPGKALDLRATLASLPELKQPEPTPSEPRKPYTGSNALKRASAWLACKEPSIQGEHGSDALLRAAQDMVRGFDLSDGEAFDLLWDEFNPRCKPLWKMGDVVRKINETRKGGSMPFGFLLDKGNDFKARYDARTVDPPPFTRKDDFNAYDEDPQQSMPGQGEKAEPKPSELAARWMPVGKAIKEQFDDTVGNPPKKRDWLLTDKEGEGVFPFGKCGILAAGGGTGKTAALCQLAVSVVLGVDWLGFKVPTTGKVILALGEEDLAEVWRRLNTIVNNLYRVRPASSEQIALDVKAIEENIIALPLAGCPVSFIGVDAKKQLETTKELDIFRKLLAEEKDVRLIILDPLSRFAGLETEKDNAAATRFVQAVESLATSSGAAVMVASHSSQASQQDGRPNVRGVTAILDGFRWVAALAKEGDYIRLEQLKTNYSAWFKPIYLEMPKKDNKVIPILVVPDQDAAKKAIEETEQEEKKRRPTKKKCECGGFLYEKDKFCNQCGKSLNSPVAAKQETNGAVDPFGDDE